MNARRLRRRNSQAGISLLEVTFVFTITIAIMGALSPAISSTLRRTRTARVTADQNSLFTAFGQLIIDINSYPVTNGANTGNVNYKIQLMVSDGDTAPCAAVLATSCDGSRTSWNRAVNNPANVSTCAAVSCVDFLERHLITNRPGGGTAMNYSVAATVWRGAYINGPIDPDPWGNRYLVNSLNANDGGNSVIVLSPGPDETIQTNFLGNPPVAAGDDILRLIQA